MIPADCPSSLLLPTSAGCRLSRGRGFVQQTNPSRHQVCNTRSLQVIVPLFLPLALQVSCLPDPPSGPQAAVIDTMSQTPRVSPLLLAGVRTVTREPICQQEQCTHDSPVRLSPACPTPSHPSKPPMGTSDPQAQPGLQLQAPHGFVLSPGYPRPSVTEKFLLEPPLRGVYINYEILSL